MPCTGGFGIEYQHIWELMACNEVLIPPPPAKVPPSPSSSIFLLLPSNWKWLLLDFSHIATSNKHMFTFLKLLQVIKCRHNWFLKKLKHYIKETRFYHHAMGACPGTRNTDIFSLNNWSIFQLFLLLRKRRNNTPSISIFHTIPICGLHNEFGKLPIPRIKPPY